MQNFEAIEKRLWRVADQLRSNGNFPSNEYFLPVMGIIFLRHAYNRYLLFKDEIEASLPKRGGVTRPLSKDDFTKKSAIYLRPEAQFDYLANLSGDVDRAQKIVEAMESIEKDYEGLMGILPKQEYQTLDNDLLDDILRVFNDDELKKASGDVFGRIYEYFLTQFADQKAHDNGEFFTPISLVQMIVNVIEPDHGKVLDPACGSGGMFVQSAHFIESEKRNPQDVVTFYGQEKIATTIRLAKMNLAVHGLEGDIQQGLTYYDDRHDMLGKADFVMANPPFNVDEVDADKVKGDPRLPFGLPGVNKNKKVSNGNYLWISYFYSYLNDKGRAGFVMSSQASSASGGEQAVRRKIIETGHVDVMMSIRSNFFYTRTVPCELWFFDKAKPEAIRDKVLMIDARNIYTKVTRKIYDFSPEQQKNLSSIIWLYRGHPERFLSLVEEYLNTATLEAGKTDEPLAQFEEGLSGLLDKLKPFLSVQDDDAVHAGTYAELTDGLKLFSKDIAACGENVAKASKGWVKSKRDNKGLQGSAKELAPVADTSRDLLKQIDLLYKLSVRLIDVCEKELDAKDSEDWDGRDIKKLIKTLDELRFGAVEQLKRVRYFYKQAHWLQERFPYAKLRDVDGLVKLVDHAVLESNDWSLTPGRYVGVAPEEVDEDFDFEEALRNIHVELGDLNAEAVELAARIAKNFEGLGI